MLNTKVTSPLHFCRRDCVTEGAFDKRHPVYDSNKIHVYYELEFYCVFCILFLNGIRLILIAIDDLDLDVNISNAAALKVIDSFSNL